MRLRITFTDTLALTLITSAVILSLLFSAVAYHFAIMKYHEEISAAARIQSYEYRTRFGEIVGDATLVLDQAVALIENSGTLRSDALRDAFLLILQTQPTFMQLRILDASGHEQLRVERTDPFPRGRLVPEAELSDKSHRYYFRRLTAHRSPSVWISHLDLNVEHGSIELPYQPTLRLGIRLPGDTGFGGAVIVNLDLRPYLTRLTRSALFDPVLIDQDGAILMHPKPQYRWSRMLETGRSVFDLSPDLPTDLFAQSRRYHPDPSLFIERFFVNPGVETLWLLFFAKDDIDAYAWSLLKAIIMINLLLFPLHLLTAYLIARSYHRLERRQKVQEELLIQNAKLASIGEMISFIAHQWRQPLNAMAGSLMRVRTDLQFERFDLERFKKTLDLQEQRLEYLSGTIETFRRFYAPAKDDAPFTLDDAVQQVLDLLGPLLRERTVAVHVTLHETPELFGRQNAFMQVLLNLINNAVDIFEARHTRKPTLHIAAYCHDGQLCLEVRDNGGGITTEPVDRIFTAYYTTHRSVGTGIGLYISRRIIASHFGGTLRAQNSAEGAVFTLCVPPKPDKDTP